MIQRLALALLLAATVAAAPDGSSTQPQPIASFALPSLPFLPGSVVPIDLNGVDAPYDLDLLGPGSIQRSSYYVPDDARGSATLLAGGRTGIAMHTLEFAPPPDPQTPFIAVASYDDGVVIHELSPPFTQRAILGVGGSPSDVAIDDAGHIGAAATNGTTGVVASLDPWAVKSFDTIPFADEVAFDSLTHAFFATDRDANGTGAITRVLPDGTVKTRLLGLTAEGLAIDEKRRRIYVANVNDGTISIVDADSLVELRRFKALPRVFSVALNAAATRLYAVSNQSYTSPFAAAGSVAVFDLAAQTPRMIRQSDPLVFPLGVALDERDRRVYVTDERDDDIYVLDPNTLRPLRTPVRTCRTPWKPLVDDGRLYVPCARADRVDVFNASSLARMQGAPFSTGGYPLAVAVWHPASGVKR